MSDRFSGDTRLSVFSLSAMCNLMTTRTIACFAGECCQSRERHPGGLYDAYGKTTSFLALTCAAAVINVAWLTLRALERWLISADERVNQESSALLPGEKDCCEEKTYSEIEDLARQGLVVTSHECVWVVAHSPYPRSQSGFLSNSAHVRHAAHAASRARVDIPTVSDDVGTLVESHARRCAGRHTTVRGIAVHPSFADKSGTCCHWQWLGRRSRGSSCTMSLASRGTVTRWRTWPSSGSTRSLVALRPSRVVFRRCPLCGVMLARQMWMALSLMEAAHFTSFVANWGMMSDYVNERCASNNSVTANSLIFVSDNVGAIVGLVGGGLAVQVAISQLLADGTLAVVRLHVGMARRMRCVRLRRGRHDILGAVRAKTTNTIVTAIVLLDRQAFIYSKKTRGHRNGEQTGGRLWYRGDFVLFR